MGDWLEISAKTTEEAITEALIQLGTTSDKIEYEVLEKESKGFFGFGSRAAKIRARVKVEDQKKKEEELIQTQPLPVNNVQEVEKKPVVEKETIKSYEKKEQHSYSKEEKPYRHENKIVQRNQEYQNPYKSSSFHLGNVEQEKTQTEQKEPVKIENVEELKQNAEKFLRDILGTMDMQAEIIISFREPETTLEISLEGDDMGILIGKRGQTLDSLQYLVSLVINKKSNSYVKVKLDTENYRERRKETLENLARNIAFKVKRTKRPVTLEPMNPYERRIIHSALQHDKFVETHSEGEEPYRKIVVTLKRNNRDYGNRRNSYSRDYNYRRDYNNYKRARQIERETEKKTSEE